MTKQERGRRKKLLRKWSYKNDMFENNNYIGSSNNFETMANNYILLYY